jgi:hypothetical protein
MPVLMIGETERAEIKRVIEEARAHPMPLGATIKLGKFDNVLKLEDRVRVPPFFTAQLMLPVGYRVALSFEEQPAGLCSHLSVSVEGRGKKGQMPSKEAVVMIAQEFGVPFPPLMGWVEEFKSGEFAINLVSLDFPEPKGTA